ncbi:hypothetical protein [Ferroplasma sp.]|uniref:hypothetical protein n=1 Tax=Ferroplasma sp. TaxID=2591003 RepID=UPI00307D1CA9
MGKLTAIIVGYISITFAAYVVLSIAYAPLIAWLGPYFGYRFPFILGLIYLEVGSPLKNTVILETWIIIGLIVGISARKGLRAWGAASLTWTLTTLTLIISALAIVGISIFNLSNISAFGGNASNIASTVIAATAFVPYGTNFATIAMEPVLRTLIPYLSSSLISGSSPAANAESGLIAIGMHAFENYIIFVATAIISGYIMHRILYGKKKSHKKAVAAALSLFIAVIFIAMAFSSGIAAPSTAQESQSSGGQAMPPIASDIVFPFSISNGTIQPDANNGITASPNQGALSLITPQGNLYNLFAMESENNSIWSGHGLMLGTFVASANITTVLEKEYGLNYGNLGGFMPQNILLLAYNGTGHSTQASNTAASIGKTMNTNFTSIITLKDIRFSGYNVSVYLYSSTASQSQLKSDFMYAFNSNNGTISAIFSKDESSTHYNSYAMASGYLNGSIANKLGIGLHFSNLQFTAGLFEYTQYFHSSGDHHNYNLSQLMDYNKKIDFGTSSGMSLIGIGYNNHTGNFGSISKYNFTVYTNNKTLTEKTPLNTTGSIIITKTTEFAPSSINVSFNAVFPACLQYSTSIDRLSHNTVKITVHIKNNDTGYITDFNASQSAFVNHYVKYKAATFVSGNYDESNITLAPGHYANFTYTLTLNGSGIYVIPYTNISYNFQGKAFSFQTNASYIVQNKPGYLHAMNSMINSEASHYTVLGKTITTIEGFEITLVDLILVLILLMDIFIEIKGLKKFIRSRR